MNKQRYLIKTGEYQGQVFDGEGCNARPYPDAIPDVSYGDGIYLNQIKLRIKEQRLPQGQAKHCADFLDYEDLVIAFDRYGKEIFVGDSLYASIDKQVCKVTVLKIGTVYHQGCGWMTRKLSIKNEDTGKKGNLNNPSGTIKIN